MTFLGGLSNLFKGLSDLQLGDEKGTLNHLEDVVTRKPESHFVTVVGFSVSEPH